MTEDKTISNTEFEEYREIERRITQFVEDMALYRELGEQWPQECAALKDPEETLRQNRDQLRLEIEKEQKNASTYFQSTKNYCTTSNYHACLTFAFERATNLSAQLGILDRDYDSRKEALQKEYSRQMKNLLERFSALHNPPLQDAFRQFSRVPVSTPGFPAPTSSLPSAVSAGGSSWALSCEAEPSAGHPEKEARNTHISNEEENNINAVGTSTVASGTASSSATEQLTVSQRTRAPNLSHHSPHR